MSTSSSRTATAAAKSNGRSKVGTNVRALRDAHLQRNAAARAAFERHLGRFRREAKRLLGRSELRAAVAVAERIRREYQATALEHGSDPARWAASQAKHRKQVRRELGKAIPKLRALRALAAEARVGFHAVADSVLRRTYPGGFPLHVGELLPADPVAREVTEPYPLFDVSQQNVFPSLRDQSFALPAIGQVVNDVQVSMDEHTAVLNGVFGLDAIASIISRSGCGFNFTVPATGRLHIVAEVQVLHSRVNMSLQDNFGFSSGSVFAAANLYAQVVRGSAVIDLAQTVIARSLESDGDDVSTTLPTLDNTVPITFDVTTEDVFDAGTDVQILVGSEFVAATSLDDMKASVSALLWCDVKKIVASIV